MLANVASDCELLEDCMGHLLDTQIQLLPAETAEASGAAKGIVRAEGELDFRGTLGVDKEAAVGFKSIRLAFDLDTDASDEAIAQLLKLTERYCVVYQTLNKRPDLSVTVNRVR